MVSNTRKRIRMSEAEVWEFLNECRNLQVASLNRDGSPHLTTLWYAVDHNCIVFDTYAKSQKAVNVQRDPRVGLLVEAGDSYETLRGVSVNGVAEFVTDAELSCALKVKIGKRYFHEVPEDTLREQAQASRGKRVVIRVKPGKIVSWDHRKLNPASPGN